MIRKLMAGTAMLALMTTGVFSIAQAQTDPAVETPPAVTTEQPGAGADPAAPAATGTDAAAPAEPAEQQTEIAADAPTLTPDEPTIATAFMGRSVYASENPDSDNIGEVNDLIIGSDGKITHAVVGVGGFLGIGEKDVSVPFDQLQVVQTGDGDVRLIYAATREQLEAAEAFDRTAFDPEERAEEQQEATAETNAGAGTDTNMATGGGVATAPGALPGAATDTQTATTTGTETTTETVAPETETVTTIEPQPATGTEAPATTTEAPAAETEMAAGTDATTTPVVAGEGGFVSFSADQVRASSMIGQEIYGPENEAVGEVSDLILQEDGKTRAALVDVGGFLGIGEKRVAIPFNEIKMMQPTETAAVQTDPAAPAAGAADPAAPAAGTADPVAPAAGGAGTADPAAPAGAQTAATAEPRLTIAMTREQLEQLPAVQDQMAANTAAEQPAAGGAAIDPAAPAATTDPNAPAAGTGTQTAAELRRPPEPRHNTSPSRRI
jgi:sporulation protein YlmC with PRC-barrel domain